MIGIIDYGMGNLRSVQKAFEHLGYEANILSHADINGVDRLVLPGVGAFGDGMEQLRQRGWIDPIGEFVGSGKPFLGICLGMQLICDASEEGGDDGDMVAGLGFIRGQVLRFTVDEAAQVADRLKVPHMGWNQISWEREDPLLAGIDQNANVYFVHGYYVQTPDLASDADSQPSTTAVCDYGGPFSATLWRDNVWATQFHPEKSQRVGLKLLDNFARF